MSEVYIQNKSQTETIQLIALDGVTIFATLAPSQFVNIKPKPGTKITPFIIREEKTD